MDFPTLSASILSSVASRMVVYPLDTIAIQYQTATTRPLFPSTQSIATSLRGLYRGLGISIVITTPAVALYLCTYRQAKESFMPYLGESTPNYILSGICAELTSSFMWTPLEVVKARLQISDSTTSGQLSRTVRNLVGSEGVKGLYRGYAMGLAVFIPYNAVWWSSYENSKSVTRQCGITAPASQAALGSAFATTLGTLLAHPLDLLKTRYQVSTSESVTQLAAGSVVQTRSTDKLGVRYVFRNVIAENGWRGLYAGIGPRLFCSIPGSVISMAVFEYFKPDDNTKDTDNREVKLADGTDITIDQTAQ